MTAEPLVSIVLPTHNGSRYLEQSIQSCLDQTYTHWELIIVDDASTDATPSVISPFVTADHRVRQIRHDTNRKLPAALNTGFSSAQGDLLTWTSDDNCFRPRALATMVEFLQTHPDVDLVYSDYTIIDATGNPQGIVAASFPDKLAVHNCVGCCFLYRRQVAETIGKYSESLVLAEDYDFWLRASILFRLEPLHQDLYLYRQHADSLSETKVKGVICAMEKTLARMLPRLHWLESSARASGYFRLSELAWARRDVKTAVENLLCAMRCRPSLALRLTANKAVERIARIANGARDRC